VATIWFPWQIVWQLVHQFYLVILPHPGDMSNRNKCKYSIFLFDTICLWKYMYIVIKRIQFKICFRYVLYECSVPLNVSGHRDIRSFHVRKLCSYGRFFALLGCQLVPAIIHNTLFRAPAIFLHQYNWENSHNNLIV
jgi:hypothetical protein